MTLAHMKPTLNDAKVASTIAVGFLQIKMENMHTLEPRVRTLPVLETALNTCIHELDGLRELLDCPPGFHGHHHETVTGRQASSSEQHFLSLVHSVLRKTLSCQNAGFTCSEQDSPTQVRTQMSAAGGPKVSCCACGTERRHMISTQLELRGLLLVTRLGTANCVASNSRACCPGRTSCERYVRERKCSRDGARSAGKHCTLWRHNDQLIKTWDTWSRFAPFASLLTGNGTKQLLIKLSPNLTAWTECSDVEPKS